MSPGNAMSRIGQVRIEMLIISCHSFPVTFVIVPWNQTQNQTEGSKRVSTKWTFDLKVLRQLSWPLNPSRVITFKTFFPGKSSASPTFRKKIFEIFFFLKKSQIFIFQKSSVFSKPVASNSKTFLKSLNLKKSSYTKKHPRTFFDAVVPPISNCLSRRRRLTWQSKIPTEFRFQVAVCDVTYEAIDRSDCGLE